jgi:hypothetical protein
MPPIFFGEGILCFLFFFSDEMKAHYSRPEKDRKIVKPDGDVLLFAFEKYTLGIKQHHACYRDITFYEMLSFGITCEW